MPSPPRPDVARRRQRLLEAATAVFNRHGVTAPLDLVVEEAGFGRATLYRNFPDRTSLMAALLVQSIDRIEERLRTACTGDARDFGVLLRILAEHAVESAPMVDYWRTMAADHPAVTAARSRLVALAEAPIARAKAERRCSASLEPGDIPLITGMLGAGLRGRTAEERRRLARRALDFLAEGLLAPTSCEHR